MKSHEELTEISLRNARENPDDLALWLACEVLLSDKTDLGDDELASRLIGLQDRLSDLTRVRYGIPVGKVPPLRSSSVTVSEAGTEPPFNPDWPRSLGAFEGILDDQVDDLSKLRDSMRLIKTMEEERQKSPQDEEATPAAGKIAGQTGFAPVSPESATLAEKNGYKP